MVEDGAAATFSQLWAAHFDPRAASSVEFISMNGDGNVVIALEAFPKNSRNILLLGLLDGDMENREMPDGVASNVVFLPGGKPIEAIYREMLETEIERVEPILGIANIAQILFRIRGLELHDWFEELCVGSQLTKDQLHLMLFRSWISNRENRDLAKYYFESLRDKIDL